MLGRCNVYHSPCVFILIITAEVDKRKSSTEKTVYRGTVMNLVVATCIIKNKTVKLFWCRDY